MNPACKHHRYRPDEAKQLRAVMPALVAGIHVSLVSDDNLVDGWVKPGHDPGA